MARSRKIFKKKGRLRQLKKTGVSLFYGLFLLNSKKQKLKHFERYKDRAISKKLLKNPYRIYQPPKSLYSRVRDRYFGKLFLLLVGTQVYLLIWSPFFEIKGYHIQGVEMIEKKEVHDLVDAFLDSRTFWIFPNKNIFIFRCEALAGVFSKRFSVNDLSISKKILEKRVDIRISERYPVYVLVRQDQFYYVDALGYVIARIEQETALRGDYPLVYQEMEFSADPIQIGAGIFGESFVDSVLHIDHQLTLEPEIDVVSYKITPSATVVIKETEKEDEEKEEKQEEAFETDQEKGLEKNQEDKEKADTEENKKTQKEEKPEVAVEIVKTTDFYYPELTVITRSGCEIYFGDEVFKENNSVSLQLNNLSHLLESNKQLDFGELAYLDLRFVNKIFYKYKK